MNGMKTDLTEEQFMALVAALARVFTGGTFDERAFPDGMTPVAGGAGCREERGISGRPFRSGPWLFLGFGFAAIHANSRMIHAVG
jgi:hypothetical protein